MATELMVLCIRAEASRVQHPMCMSITVENIYDFSIAFKPVINSKFDFRIPITPPYGTCSWSLQFLHTDIHLRP